MKALVECKPGVKERGKEERGEKRRGKRRGKKGRPPPKMAPILPSSKKISCGAKTWAFPPNPPPDRDHWTCGPMVSVGGPMATARRPPLFWGCLRKCNSTYNLIQFANLTAVKQKGNSTLELSLCDCRTSSKTTGPLSKKEQLDTAFFFNDGCCYPE